MLVDDFDGATVAGPTTTFALNGVEYEIDLGPENLAKLEAALEPFIRAGRRVSAGAPKRQGKRAEKKPSAGRDLAAIREWAKDNGYAVGDRGRIPQQVIAAFEAAHA